MNTLQKYILYLLFSLPLITNAQQVIQNHLSKEYTNIPGTKVRMIIPDNFIISTNFMGIQQPESNASVMVIDLPTSFSEVSKGISKENLSNSGIIVTKIDSLTFDDLPALLVEGFQYMNEIKFSKFILIFGSEQETIMLNGNFPENYSKVGKLVKQAILTSLYEADITIDPFDVLDYSLNDTSSHLKFTKSFSNSLIYTLDQKIPTTSPNKQMLIVTKSVSNVYTDDKKEYALNRLHQIPYQLDSIIHIQPISINEMSGYEIYAQATSTDTKTETFLYQVMLFTNDSYYLFLGSSNENSEETLSDYRSIIQTFKRK